jgi:hypothetical protein
MNIRLGAGRRGLAASTLDALAGGALGQQSAQYMSFQTTRQPYAVPQAVGVCKPATAGVVSCFLCLWPERGCNKQVAAPIAADIGMKPPAQEATEGSAAG